MLGSVTWFFSFFFFFGDSHQELGDGGHGRLVRFSLSLSFLSGTCARASRGCRSRWRSRSSSSLHLFGFAPFQPVKGGIAYNAISTRFSTIRSQNRSNFFADVENSVSRFHRDFYRVLHIRRKKRKKKIPPWPILVLQTTRFLHRDY